MSIGFTGPVRYLCCVYASAAHGRGRSGHERHRFRAVTPTLPQAGRKGRPHPMVSGMHVFQRACMAICAHIQPFKACANVASARSRATVSTCGARGYLDRVSCRVCTGQAEGLRGMTKSGGRPGAVTTAPAIPQSAGGTAAQTNLPVPAHERTRQWVHSLLLTHLLYSTPYRALFCD